MPDEKKDHDLDADILQSKADILKALRAAGKPTSSEPIVSPEQSSEPTFEEDFLDEADIVDLTDNGSEHAELEELDLDELISVFPEEELVEEEPIRIVPFEESQQYNGSTDSEPSDIIDFPESPENAEAIDNLKHKDSPLETQASSETKPDVPDFDIEQLRRNIRQLNDRTSTLLEENTRLKADLQDYLQTGNQVQRFRSELSEAEVALSREHSKTRQLETKIDEIESLKALLEQDCRSFTERIEQLQQEKEQFKDTLKRIQEEQSDNREKTGRQIVDLNQHIENLTEQRDELQQKADSLGQTVNSLNQEAAVLRKNTEALSETERQLEDARTELEEAKSNISQEQEGRSVLEQEVGELRATCDKNNSTKEQLRSEIGNYEAKVQHLDGELSALRQRHIQEQDDFTAQLQQEKQHSTDTLDRLEQEHSEYHEKTDSQIGKLTQRIERMSEKADLAKRAYEELRHEYEAYQSQTGGEITILTEQRGELQQEADSLRQTVETLNQEVTSLRENAGVLSETNEQLESVRAELEEIKSKLSQEQEEHASLIQETERLHTVANENDRVKEHLRSEISNYESQVQNVNAELSALRQQHSQEQNAFSAQLQQEKDKLKGNLERLAQEYSDYREQTGRETVELKTDYERVRQEHMNFNIWLSKH